MSVPKALEVPGYQVMRYLGSGARSTIWQIRDRRTDEVYALKRVVKRESADLKFMDQVYNEHAIGSQLNHPTLRKMIRLHRVKRWLAIRELHLIMEYCYGTTVAQDRPESVIEIVRIFTEVGKALAHMNNKGFVHADIKPNNIIVDDQGGVKIIDMGQSCPVGTIKDRIQGTPDFIAPEQVHRRPLDGRTDMFNLGAALYWTLTGRAIPTALPRRGAVTLVSEMAVVRPEDVNAEVTQPLSKLIMDCIEPLPDRRPASMNEVVSRLGLIAHTQKKRRQDSPNNT